MRKVEAPGGAKDILLHACCAPCAGAVLECLLANAIRPTVFFSNSNIYPRAEYDLRLGELRRYADALGVELVADEYDHDAWLAAVRGLEREPERGARCAACFRFRLERAAQYAASRCLPVLATTLASSRWKDLDQVNEAGTTACSASLHVGSGLKTSFGPHRFAVPPLTMPRVARFSDPTAASVPPQAAAVPVVFWAENWRKGGLQERRNEVIREQAFYNQTWCGCEFSRQSNP